MAVYPIFVASLVRFRQFAIFPNSGALFSTFSTIRPTTKGLCRHTHGTPASPAAERRWNSATGVVRKSTFGQHSRTLLWSKVPNATSSESRHRRKNQKRLSQGSGTRKARQKHSQEQTFGSAEAEQPGAAAQHRVVIEGVFPGGGMPEWCSKNLFLDEYGTGDWVKHMDMLPTGACRCYKSTD